ncbi:conserved protein of unknown function [Modestobacter italicus]|uniref:SnoaL-like domain-containing protein n=1 Tax=Modestobacter italicus (strain DSM 44449 / CECT 9708 / BC 501) TaxID=2732864 RepID=I4EXI1_MODI5|nr:hypothetical protein [Modestobacter marinus]CCH88094.1 conserved protein of unknown function [Modestobacter marinus]
MFDTISTEFTRSLDDDRGSSLEWTSRGTRTGGGELTYTGVTVIDVANEQGTGVRTYYDSAAFLGPSAG